MWPERRREAESRLYICGPEWPAPGKLFAEGRWRRFVRCGWERREEGAQLVGVVRWAYGDLLSDLELRGQVWAEMVWRLLDRPMVWARSPQGG